MTGAAGKEGISNLPDTRILFFQTVATNTVFPIKTKIEQAM